MGTRRIHGNQKEIQTRNMKTNELACFADRRAKQKLIELCEQEEGISTELLMELCSLVPQYTGKEIKLGLNDKIASVIDHFSTE